MNNPILHSLLTSARGRAAAALAAIALLAGCAGTPKMAGPEPAPTVTEQPQEQGPVIKTPGMAFYSPGRVKFFDHTINSWQYLALPHGLAVGDRVRVAPDSGFAELYFYKDVLVRLSSASTLGVLGMNPPAFELIAGQAEIWNNSAADISVLAEGATTTAGKGLAAYRITGRNSTEVLVYKGSALVKKGKAAQAVPEMKKLFISAEGAFYLSPVGRFNSIPPAPEPQRELIRQIEELFAQSN